MDNDLRGRPDTVLVTGSSGYLGYAVARRLSRRYAVSSPASSPGTTRPSA
ncbi:MAG: hypothetical protein QN195_06070 [Armatimonadota bacterium]|nr:hypothetical protein [Armatimonadota bacterium]MDR7449890.1 hypothetical protein [Armatimonadota bacterium]MDR7459200.1 hypothetical protein [Armatimonadota bacterium]MDR7487835.1 hypothetical protein [Armatimonadota bacterium]MDR7575695.1 hypothetical protein [Armatimonadota bacterium]